ncbi:MAG: nickel-responsive transcriptional regulator NikR [Candidatus Zipacnadales bacterium]
MRSHAEETVTRFSVSMEPGLLKAFDERIAQVGYESRSRAISDIVRSYLVEQQWQQAEAEVVGTVTIVYDHHDHDVEQRLTELQHDHHDAIACTTHVHLNHNNCLEVIVVRGRTRQVRALADRIITCPGVKHGRLVCTSATEHLHG